ncbi:MAG: nucleotidyltransferase [Eubacteriales bacterium]|nr:nucleotidyltransferase [Eubacteriales bacterium]
MKVAGIIAEYNPFHKGHEYHIKETRRVSGADYVIVVMSGDFVQRGEPAIADKYLRTKMALEGGADLVIELPSIYATASAEYFATAGVGILDALGVVDDLSFGSEWAGADALGKIADLLIEEPPLFKEKLKEYLEDGKNYPQAREAAVMACLQDPSYERILETPNHILGIEYIKALKRLGSKIQPLVIERKGSGYHADSWNGDEKEYPSATALRRLLKEMQKGQLSDLSVLEHGIPYGLQELLDCLEHRDFVSWEDLMPLLDYTFLMKQQVLGKYFGMDYDISKRIEKRYVPGKSFEEMVQLCHSRNYTDAALRRILLHLVLQTKDYPFLSEGARIPIPYARILGFRKASGKLISAIRENSQIPVIQKTTEGKDLDKANQIAHIIFNQDLRYSNLYEQIASTKAGRDYRVEFIRNPVIV